VENKEFKIFFFGDSICFGQGVSLHKGWVAQLSRSITESESIKSENLLFVNSSVNGNTTRIALERMPYDVQSHEPDIVIVQFGLNDCNYWDSDKGVSRVSPGAFAANLKEIIQRCFVHGAKKVILNSNHPTLLKKQFKYSDVDYNDSNKTFNELIRGVFESLGSDLKKNTIFIDIEKYFNNLILDSSVELKDLLLLDGLHLSESGHDLYFEKIITKLEEVILEVKN